MTRIFEALKKTRMARPAAPPAPAPLRSHPAGAAAAANPALPMVDPARLGLAPRPFQGDVDLPEDVLREMTALRMTLETALPPGTPRTVMLLSAQQGEGTSTVAAQLAAALAGDGRLRVLLMDVNARRPSPFVEGAGSPGARMTPGVRPIRQGGASEAGAFDVLPVPAQAREAGVIAAPAMREWLDSMTGRYDWIVLDGPAVMESPDAPALAATADGVVVVIEAGRTKSPVLHRATELLRKARARLIGSVLNRRRLEIPEFLYRRI